MVLDSKAEEDSVSTHTADLEGRRTDLVGMVLRVMDSEAVVTEVVAEDSAHPEVAVGMGVGTVPTLNGRAQGWTRIAIQSDQGIEHILHGGPHHGVSLPQPFPVYSFSLSLVILPSLPPTCCVSIQCFRAAVRISPQRNPSHELRNYPIIISFLILSVFVPWSMRNDRLTKRIVGGMKRVLVSVRVIVPLFDEASCVCSADDIDCWR